MTTRAAVEADVDAVAALEAATFGMDAWSTAQVREELLGARRRALVALDAAGERVVGYAVTALAGDVVDLQRIAVAPAHRRGGVARVLLDGVRALARTDGAHRMLLEVSAGNSGARAFYAAEGFVQIDVRRGYYRDGSDALVLRGDLGTAACGRKGA